MPHGQTALATPVSPRTADAKPAVVDKAAPMTTQPMLEVIDAVHAYGDVVALDNVTVTAAPGEFLTILGESGSGKTTLLRLISGLEKPYKIGALRLNGVDVSHVPAYARNCNTVFQN